MEQKFSNVIPCTVGLKSNCQTGGNLPYKEVLKKLNQINQIYIEILGPENNWNADLRKQIVETKYAVMIHQSSKTCDPDDEYYWDRF